MLSRLWCCILLSSSWQRIVSYILSYNSLFLSFLSSYLYPYLHVSANFIGFFFVCRGGFCFFLSLSYSVISVYYVTLIKLWNYVLPSRAQPSHQGNHFVIPSFTMTPLHYSFLLRTKLCQLSQMIQATSRDLHTFH